MVKLFLPDLLSTLNLVLSTTGISTSSEFIAHVVTDLVTATGADESSANTAGHNVPVEPSTSASTKIVTEVTSIVVYTDTYITSYYTVTVGGNGAKSSFLTTDTLTTTSSSSSVYGTTATSVVQVVVTPSASAASEATTPAQSDLYSDVYTTVYVTSYLTASTNGASQVSSVFVESTVTDLSTSAFSTSDQASITTVTYSTSSSSASPSSTPSTSQAGPQVVTVDVEQASTQYVYATVHKRYYQGSTFSADFSTVLVDSRDVHEAEVTSISQGGAGKIGATFVLGFAGWLVLMF
ncbi:unnamed protein product [Ambrosiozyma monospora]|uniref:Unnamed protein product n=1 Tax=Ambrosiozyma monospora TaxID=43982 RepID=A0ACB5SYK9_AMBMO|nr:unnamed protein product [Ambrosiozyma monospora]